MLKTVIVIGGGLSGLIAAIRLTRAGIGCTLIEKKSFPFHRVCGEYVSNETLPFLNLNGLLPTQFQLPAINQFQLSSVSGKSKKLTLDLGGFGVSRYVFDYFLLEKAIESGVEVVLKQEVGSVRFSERNNLFEVSTGQQNFTSGFIVGAFGKRSKVDNTLNRRFLHKRSPYVAVKYHLRTNHPANLIALHNFNGGYCGISNIEDGKTNLCYLVHRDLVKRFKSIPELEKNVLAQNPFLERIFSNSEFLFDRPETINEISFETKEPVLNHTLMVGDAAGMIAPLCGNGMAMAIQSGKLVSDIIIQSVKENRNREWVEHTYSTQWKKIFSKRLWAGRIIQNNLFGSEWSSRLGVNLALHSKPLANFIIRNTHGEPF